MAIGKLGITISVCVMLFSAAAGRLHRLGDPEPAPPYETEEDAPRARGPHHASLRQPPPRDEPNPLLQQQGDPRAAVRPHLQSHSSVHSDWRALEPERRYAEHHGYQAAAGRADWARAWNHERAGGGRLEAAGPWGPGGPQWLLALRTERTQTTTSAGAETQSIGAATTEAPDSAFTSGPSPQAAPEAEDGSGTRTTESSTAGLTSDFAIQAQLEWEAEVEAANDPPETEEEEEKREWWAKRVLAAVAASLSALFFFLALACCFCPRSKGGSVTAHSQPNLRRHRRCGWWWWKWWCGREREDLGERKRKQRRRRLGQWRRDRRQVVNVIYRRPLVDAFGLSTSCTSLEALHHLKGKGQGKRARPLGLFPRAGCGSQTGPGEECRLLQVLEGSGWKAGVGPQPAGAEPAVTAPSPTAGHGSP